VTRWAWLLDHIREELSPYPGRVGAVGRMTAGSTIMMLLAMTFRLPYAQYGALYPLSISRNTSRGIVAEVRTIVFAFGAAALYLLVGATIFLHDPSLRLVWVIGTFFLMFYLMSAMANSSGAQRFGYLLIITLPLWDRFVLVEFKVETTLWAFATLSLASVTTLAIELASAGLRPRHQLLQPLADRLASVESMLRSAAAGEPLDDRTRDDITRYAMMGTTRVRTTLFHSSYSPQYREQMGAVIALVGRLTDLAANAVQLSPTVSDSDRTKMATLLATVGTIRSALLSGGVPHVVEPVSDPGVPLFDEMEHTVSLIAAVFAGSPLGASAPLSPTAPSTGESQVRFLVADAFSNPRHILFGLKGCLAATLCYVIYNGVDWPGISTAVTTTFLTALTTVGASHQKQMLRIGGACVGGLMGIAAQVFILPQIDSIGGFTVLFVLCTVVFAWVITSSARLSYAGVQMAFAFFLVTTAEFAANTSLTPARDRVVGILLGLFVMWIVFDQLWGSRAAVAMKREFISTLRLLAQFVREPLTPDTRAAGDRIRSLRETINSAFDRVRALGDGVLFEFGPTRAADLAWHRRFLAWQPQLRLVFLTRVALVKYRLGVPGFQVAPALGAAQTEFDRELAKRIDGMADRLEGKTSQSDDALEQSLAHLDAVGRAAHGDDVAPEPAAPLNGLLSLSRRIERLTTSLDQEVGLEPAA
jgi:multidrug resistance protein MdtO